MCCYLKVFCCVLLDKQTLVLFVFLEVYSWLVEFNADDAIIYWLIWYEKSLAT